MKCLVIDEDGNDAIQILRKNGWLICFGEGDRHYSITGKQSLARFLKQRSKGTGKWCKGLDKLIKDLRKQGWNGLE